MDFGMDAMRVLVLLRPTMTRFAPSAASASAAANPMPLVAPVIRICLSFTARQSKALANARDELFEVKDLALEIRASQPHLRFLELDRFGIELIAPRRRT